MSSRILVVGDSGVGKTSFIHMICQGSILNTPDWTVGCNVDVKVVGADSMGQHFCVELLDVGCHHNFELSRSVYYVDIDAIILVYDLTNVQSFRHLRNWILELRSYFSGQSQSIADRKNFNQGQYASSHDIAGRPVLIVGNKLDLIGKNEMRHLPDVLKTYGFESINTSSQEVNAEVISHFLSNIGNSSASSNHVSSSVGISGYSEVSRRPMAQGNTVDDSGFGLSRRAF